MPKGSFVGLDLPTLQSLRSQYTDCVGRIAAAGQSYTVAGRTFTRADLSEVKDTLAELTYAIRLVSKTGARRVKLNFTNPNG